MARVFRLRNPLRIDHFPFLLVGVGVAVTAWALAGSPGFSSPASEARERQEAERQVAFQRASAAALPEIHAAVERSASGAAPPAGSRFAVVRAGSAMFSTKRRYELLDARTGCLWRVNDQGGRRAVALDPESVSPPGCLDAAPSAELPAPSPACSRLASPPGYPVEVRVGQGPPCESLTAPKAP